MYVKLPCQLGEYISPEMLLKIKPIAKNDKTLLSRPLYCVSWFMWHDGTEFTYVFGHPNDRGNYSLATVKARDAINFPVTYEVKDSLLITRPFTQTNFPFLGQGYISGLSIEQDGNLYADTIIESHYFTHVRTQCDASGQSLNTKLIFPPAYQLNQRLNILRADYKYLADNISVAGKERN